MGRESGLTAKEARAAVLIAEDELTNDEIALQLGIAGSTLDRWKTRADIQAAVNEHIAILGTQLQKYHIARKDRRMAAYQSRWEKQQQVIRERANDPTMLGVPGAPTGMMVRTYKSVGVGRDAQLVEEYAYDTGLDAAMRATEKQAAQEAGQWSEKSEVKHTLDAVDELRRMLGVDSATV